CVSVRLASLPADTPLSLRDALPIFPGLYADGAVVDVGDLAVTVLLGVLVALGVLAVVAADLHADGAVVDVGDLASHGCLAFGNRSEEHTSELQSRFDLVCRLLLA